MPTPHHHEKTGFTLFEVILVVVIIGIMAGISIPFIGRSMGSSKLKISGRTVRRMNNYARSMSILKNKKYCMMIDEEKMDIYLGSVQSNSTTNDGELDMDVLRNLGYGDYAKAPPQIDIEQRKSFPQHISLKELTIDPINREEESNFDNVYVIRYYPNGKADRFVLELEDPKGVGIGLETDSITGKISDKIIKAY